MGNTFRRDLTFGNDAEQALYNAYIDKLERTDGRKADLIIKASGYGIQLKADRRKSTDTGNIFIEEFSHSVKKTPGGPYKAELDGCKYFVYMFTDDKLFTYDNKALIAYLEANKHKYKRHEVRTVKSNAVGYIVPIKDLEQIELDFNAILG